MKAKIEEILDCIEMVNGEIDCYYNKDNGEIFLSNIGEYTDINEDELEELFEKSIILPTHYEIDEYNIIQDFIETIKNPKLQKSLYKASNGKKAFRRFKDTCIENNIIEDWYKYRKKRYKQIAIDWCKENNIEFE